MLFINFRLQFGFRFTFAKEQAIVLGDLSNTIIHPFFIHFAHMFGCNIYLEQQRNYVQLPILGVHLQLALASLVEMTEDDPLSFAQACFFMMIACMYNYNSALGKRCLNLVISTVRRNDIRYVSLFRVHVPDFTEEVHERASFLSELICAEVDMILVTGEKHVVLTDLRKQFTQELLVRGILT
jgi:hypothetical protein